jgi:nucleotide-binding universal stress UspA family protein
MTAIDAPARTSATPRAPHRVDDPWRHILVAADGGPASMAAVTRAVELARRDRAALSILVAPPIDGPGLHVDRGVPVAVEVLVERARATGVAVDVLVRPGAAGQAIVDAATDLDADLVIVGRRGSRHDLPSGTATCGYVLTHCDRPVLVVQPWAPGAPPA